MCLKGGHAQWVECEHGNGWTKKKSQRKNHPLPHLQCSGSVLSVRALRVATQQFQANISVDVLLIWMCRASLMLSSAPFSYLHGPLWLPPPSPSDGVHSMEAPLWQISLLQAFWYSGFQPPYCFTDVNLPTTARNVVCTLHKISQIWWSNFSFTLLSWFIVLNWKTVLMPTFLQTLLVPAM